MTADNGNRSSRGGSLALGAALVILGGLFILAQLFDIDVGSFAWPFFIILPGVLLFIFAVVTGGAAGEVVAIIGSMVTMTGVLLWYQNTFNHFESWAYAWALVVPTSIGLGRMVYGSLKGDQDSIRAGRRLAMIGGVIFLGGAIFFELLIGLSGFSLGGYGWAILLVGLGAFFILRSLWPRGSARPTEASAETDDSTQPSDDIEETLDE
jgi:hypothetical protein